MTITTNSRYATDPLVMIAGSDGVNRTTITLPEPSATQFSFMLHTVTGFDRLDNLANTYLGDSSLWWQITDVNPELIDWSVLPVGVQIRIPVN